MYRIIKEERGIALIASLLILAALTTLSIVAVNTTITDSMISGNVKEIKEAHYIAQAGISHAAEYLRVNQAIWDGATASAQTLTLGSTAIGAGSYSVTMTAAGVDRRRIISTGTTDSGATRRIEAFFGITSATIPTAMVTGGALEISGNPTISGTCGSVHSNTDLTISGNPEISGSATASSACSGAPCSIAPAQDVPVVVPTNFYNLADIPFTHTLKCDGTGAFNAAGTQVTPPPAGWAYDGSKWVLSGKTPADNLKVRVDCDVEVTTNGGSDADPLSVTIYADGDFKVSGNPTMGELNIITTGNVEISGNINGNAGSSAEISVIAGLDVKISGNGNLSAPAAGMFEGLFVVGGGDLDLVGNVETTQISGLMAVHEQIKFSGNPTLIGAVIAEDAADVRTLVTGASSVSGNLNITYDCGLNPAGLGLNQITAALRREL
ncbi:MAG: hypothetical protein KKC21_00330 [Nitrospinae bacterium]|nr:hypothetical protein [Nitrospinota bacterium]